MVFFYTNYAAETNAWWLKRIRPLWIFPVIGISCYKYYRVVYYAKNQIEKEDETEVSKLEFLANEYKGDFGYHRDYKPKLQKSMKKKLREELGGKLKR